MNTSKPFLIVGMPTTETAWLSAFLSIGTSVVYHEPMGRLSELEELKSVYRSNSYYKYVGIADNGLGFFINWMTDHIAPAIVILDKSVEDAQAEWDRMGMPRTNYLEVAREELLKHKDDENVLWVPNESLRSKRVMQKVFWHCLPGEPFDEVRYAEFARYKIDQNFDEVKKIAQMRRDVFLNLMRDTVLPKMKALAA